jgi:hypothetical protein
MGDRRDGHISVGEEKGQHYPTEDLVLAWELALWLRKVMQVPEIYAGALLEVLVGNTVGVRVPSL